MSVKLIVVALLAVSASIVAAQAPTPPKKVLTVKTCASDTCACTAAGEMKKYEAGQCVKEDGSDKHWRLDTCTADQDAMLTSFASEKDCNMPETLSVPNTCTPVSYMKVDCTTADTIMLYTGCQAGCSDLATCGTSISFTSSDNCKAYSGGKYLKATTFDCDGNFEIHDDNQCNTESPASLAKPKECTAFSYEAGACTPGTSAAIKTCSDEACTTCTGTQDFTLNTYTAYKDKSYLIKECVADTPLKFTVYSVAPETKTIPHECKEAGSAVYTMGTCGDEEPVKNPDPNQGGNPVPVPELEVLKECSDNTCGASTCTSVMKYPLNQCTEKDNKFYKAACDAQGGATLKEYASKTECEDTNNAGTAVTLPTNECVADTSSNKFEKVVCLKAPKPGDNVPGNEGPGGYDGPIITVNASCSDDNCVTCQTLVYLANGSCFAMPMPPPGKAPAVAGSRRQQRPQEQTPAMKYYKADCGNLTVTTYTDKDCSTEEKKVTYTSTCDKTNKAIAECTIPTAASTNPPVEPPVDGPVAGPGEGKDTTSSNNTTGEEGLYAPCVHSLGALAVALLVTVLLY